MINKFVAPSQPYRGTSFLFNRSQLVLHFFFLVRASRSEDPEDITIEINWPAIGQLLRGEQVYQMSPFTLFDLGILSRRHSFMRRKSFDGLMSYVDKGIPF